MGNLVSQAQQIIRLTETARAIDAPRAALAGRFRLEGPNGIWKYLGLEPLPHQRAALEHPARFRVDVWHRRAGKSRYSLLKLIDRAYWNPLPRPRYAYLAPTYAQVSDIIWSELRAIADKIPGAEVLAGSLSVFIPTFKGEMARIRLYGVDSPKQRLRGSYLDGVVLDEWQDSPESVWTEQVRPMLADKSRAGVDQWGRVNQWANFIGTPKGKNHLYTMFTRAERWEAGESVIIRDDSGRTTEVHAAGWAATRLSALATGMISDDELAQIRAEVGAEAFSQEFLCDFESGAPGAILRAELEELRDSGRIGDFPVNPYLPVMTAWDLGWNDASVVWFFQMAQGRPVFVDYLIATNANIPTLVQLVREKGYRLGKNFFPWDVAVHDLSGDGKSRADIFRRYGITPSPVKRTSLPDGIAALRRLIQRACFDRTRCGDGLDLLWQYRREKDAKSGLLKAEPVENLAIHVADALRTAALGLPKWTFSGTTVQGLTAGGVRPEAAEISA